MFFKNGVSKPVSQFLSNYLTRLIDGIDFGLVHPVGYLLAVAAYMVLCAVWVISREVVYMVSDALSHSGIWGLKQTV